MPLWLRRPRPVAGPQLDRGRHPRMRIVKAHRPPPRAHEPPPAPPVPPRAGRLPGVGSGHGEARGQQGHHGGQQAGKTGCLPQSAHQIGSAGWRKMIVPWQDRIAQRSFNRCVWPGRLGVSQGGVAPLGAGGAGGEEPRCPADLGPPVLAPPVMPPPSCRHRDVTPIRQSRSAARNAAPAGSRSGSVAAAVTNTDPSSTTRLRQPGHGNWASTTLVAGSWPIRAVPSKWNPACTSRSCATVSTGARLAKGLGARGLAVADHGAGILVDPVGHFGRGKAVAIRHPV